MALVLGDNFSYGGSKPLDARLKYETLANMKAVADPTMYDGCMAYCKETDKTYQWKSTNIVDVDTGRWREFSSGGGTGGGHTIEDSEGTDLTQRDTLQFGEGFKAEDDDTNEKTVISPDVMQSEDMDDVITPLPSVAPRKGSIKYSTTEQVVGEWIDGKPLYQKTFVTTLQNTAGETIIDMSSLNIDDIVSFIGIHASSTYWGIIPIVNTVNNVAYSAFPYYVRATGSFRIQNDIQAYFGRDVLFTIQYTKTTD